MWFAIALLGAWLVACSDDGGSVPSPQAEEVIHAPPVAASQVASVADGHSVRFAGTVDRVFDDGRAVIVSGVPVVSAEPVMLREIPIAVGDEVVVMGIVRTADDATLAQEVGHEVPPVITQLSTHHPVVIARDVRRRSGTGWSEVESRR